MPLMFTPRTDSQELDISDARNSRYTYGAVQPTRMSSGSDGQALGQGSKSSPKDHLASRGQDSSEVLRDISVSCAHVNSCILTDFFPVSLRAQNMAPFPEVRTLQRLDIILDPEHLKNCQVNY